MSDFELKMIMLVSLLIQLPIIAHVHGCVQESCPWEGLGGAMALIGVVAGICMILKRC